MKSCSCDHAHTMRSPLSSSSNAGFEVIGTTGYGIAASLIGQPDIGLIGYTEILERSRTIMNAVKLPVDVDVDTGYGNALNAYWTVLNFARVGAAGVRVEDQEWPKRCGHMAGKSIVSGDEMLGKIKAAVKARDEEDPDMVIGARTDARSITSFDETVERAASLREGGCRLCLCRGSPEPRGDRDTR